MYNPKGEGIDHINAYSRSNTKLGKMLSNFKYAPFKCEDGLFDSIEGYWYWLIAGSVRDREPLRRLHGFRAKEYARSIGCKDWRDDKIFKIKIKRALWYKITTNSRIKDALCESSLPIVHYYTFGDNPPKIVEPKEGKWIWEAMEEIRSILIERKKVKNDIPT